METKYLKVVLKIKDGAIPPDNIIKFAYDDADYEEIQEWVDYTAEQLADKKAATEAAELQDVVNSLPDAVAELSATVSTNVDDMTTVNDAIAELSEMVSNLTETVNALGGKVNG